MSDALFSLCLVGLCCVWWGSRCFGLTLGVGVSRLFTCRRELVSEFVVVVHCLGGWVLWLGCLGVWVLFVNSIVCLFVFLCLFFVFECFWLGLLTGRFCLVGFSGL